MYFYFINKQKHKLGRYFSFVSKQNQHKKKPNKYKKNEENIK